MGICTGFVLGLFSLPRSLRLEKAAASASGRPSVAPLSLLRGQISPDSARGRSQWDARARLSVRRAQPMNIRLGRVAPPSPPPRPAPGPCERSVLFSCRFFFFFRSAEIIQQRLLIFVQIQTRLSSSICIFIG